jgi:hypothetical protein
MASSGLGHALAMALLHTLGQPTVYLEYLEARQRVGPADIDPATCTYRHAAGYDVFIPHEEGALPPVVRTTLTLDHLMGQYRHVIMVVSDMTDSSVPVLLEQATHLVVVAPPTSDGRQGLRRVRAGLARSTTSGRLGLSVIVDYPPIGVREPWIRDEADYVLPLSEVFPVPHPLDSLPALPEAVAQVVNSLIDRIKRTHQLAIYIPTTMAVDQMADTSPYDEHMRRAEEQARLTRAEGYQAEPNQDCMVRAHRLRPGERCHGVLSPLDPSRPDQTCRR